MNELSQTYKRYLLGVLLLIFAFNLVDRMALGLVMQDIKLDLGLSDTQLGLMSGIAFAIFYSVMGIPIARWADRGDRVQIIWLTTALWSVALAFCGLAGTFVQLLLIRILVGVGEAGCGPPAQSLIAEHFTRAERPRSASIYSLGAPLGKVIGYFGAGWLNQLYGWRVTFFLLGIPGLVLAAVAAFSLKEPRRKRPAPSSTSASLARTATSSATPGLAVVIVALWSNVTFRHLLIAYSVLNFFIFGVTQWQPAFFVRSFGLQTGALGTWFALIFAVAGMGGVYLGGRWGARRPHQEQVHLRAGVILYGALGVVSPFIYLSPNAYVAMGLMAVVAFAYYATFGPGVAAIQTLVPDRMRATAFAFLYLFTNLIGIGLGPLAVGVLSDLLNPWLGMESLRWALLIMSPGYAWVAWHVWRASRTIKADLEAVQRFESASLANDTIVIQARV